MKLLEIVKQSTRWTQGLAFGISVLALATTVQVANAQSLASKPVLTLEAAETMANACLKLQAASGLPPMNIAIVDDGGLLKLFNRQENAFVGSIEIAIDKAHTAAMFFHSTRFFGELVYNAEGGFGPVPGLAHVNRLMAFPGGLPIKVGDTTIGAIGVSGGTGDQDEQCAQAGLDAVKKALMDHAN